MPADFIPQAELEAGVAVVYRARPLGQAGRWLKGGPAGAGASLADPLGQEQGRLQARRGAFLLL